MERKNKGIEAENKVDRTEWMTVTGAMVKGNDQDARDFKVESMDRGGWVEGVSMIFVLAISRGASSEPAMPAADTAIARDVSGDVDERISRPPAYVNGVDIRKERPGSGKTRIAERKERVNDVIVDNRIEYT